MKAFKEVVEVRAKNLLYMIYVTAIGESTCLYSLKYLYSVYNLGLGLVRALGLAHGSSGLA